MNCALCHFIPLLLHASLGDGVPFVSAEASMLAAEMPPSLLQLLPRPCNTLCFSLA